MLRTLAKILVIVLFQLTTPLFPSEAQAADILVNEKGDILIVGPIQSGDDEKFRQTVVAEIKRRGSDNPVGHLRIYSPGGDLGAALKIGEQVHLLQMNTVAPQAAPKNVFKNAVTVPSTDPRYCDLPGEKERRKQVSDEHGRHLAAEIEERKKGISLPRKFEGRFETFDPVSRRGDARCECASACFFIWAAGAIRSGNVVGIHRPSFDPARFSTLPPSEARTQYDSLMRASKSYLAKVGISQELINRVFSIDSTKVAYLGPEELSRLGRSPHLEELLIAKCGRLTTKDELTALIDNKYAERPKWNPAEHQARAEDYANTWRCEIDATRDVHRQTNAEYLKVYDTADVLTPRRQDQASSSPDQFEAEARSVLREVLRESGIKGYWIIPSKEAKKILEPIRPGLPSGRIWWAATRDPGREILGWLEILGPERKMWIEGAAAWVLDGESKGCEKSGGHFFSQPFEFVQAAGHLTTTCLEGAKASGSFFTFISRRDGGIYLFSTLSDDSENGLEVARSVDNKMLEAVNRVLGPTSR
jgi:hypothetical protein